MLNFQEDHGFSEPVLMDISLLLGEMSNGIVWNWKIRGDIDF